MLDLLKVAIRNVRRNTRRTLITALTVFIGVVVAITTRGLLNGLQTEIRSSLTRKVFGELQVHKRGYQDSLESSPYKLLIPEQLPDPSFQSAPRLKITALLNHQKSQTTAPVLITGIDSAGEAKVCPRLAGSLQTGRMLNSQLEQATSTLVDDELEEASADKPQAAKPLARGYHQIMLTPSLLRGLNAQVGDELVVLFSDKDNMQQALVAELVGIIDVATPGVASRMAWMDLRTLQDTLNIAGKASEIAVRLADDQDLTAMQGKLQATLPTEHIVETWLQLGGTLADALHLQNLVFSTIVIILFVIVISAIVNTSLMTVMERTREIGTLMALGYRRRHIMLLFLTESATIGGLGGLAGLITAWLIVRQLGSQGIVMTLPGASLPTQLYPSISLGFLSLSFGLAIGAALISGLVPAYRASHLKPVEALSST